jgi:hypothetical protein
MFERAFCRTALVDDQEKSIIFSEGEGGQNRL